MMCYANQQPFYLTWPWCRTSVALGPAEEVDRYIELLIRSAIT